MEIYNSKELSGGGVWSWCSKHASAFFRGAIILVGLKSVKASDWNDPWDVFMERIYYWFSWYYQEKAP